MPCLHRRAAGEEICDGISTARNVEVLPPQAVERTKEPCPGASRAKSAALFSCALNVLAPKRLRLLVKCYRPRRGYILENKGSGGFPMCPRGGALLWQWRFLLLLFHIRVPVQDNRDRCEDLKLESPVEDETSPVW